LPEWLISPLIAVASVLIGIIGKGIYDTKFKKIDDAARIREELWKEVGHLREVNKELEDLRVRSTDLEIAVKRAVARVEECAEVITSLLEAEDHLDKGNVKKARTILHLIERDRMMREQMDEDNERSVGK
jgi:16S rRNA G527 N7-methylase RsmG